ncbi:hypothetical protein CC78DRAFT_575769 [Lojkania enalia]|uniref:Uncharacterized protein n=1 Tax=Lojkania enalia TaxID=147567 RepID=A0A9P4N3R2_9PLEO|nr:hypothetical protein CC78DRAFT_575769 [Didymosphaeria enalia]
MSSPSEMQYVYIPNLVGRQMLRVPVEVPDLRPSSPNLHLNTTYASKNPRTTPSREASPTPSVTISEIRKSWIAVSGIAKPFRSCEDILVGKPEDWRSVSKPHDDEACQGKMILGGPKLWRGRIAIDETVSPVIVTQDGDYSMSHSFALSFLFASRLTPSMMFLTAPFGSMSFLIKFSLWVMSTL